MPPVDSKEPWIVGSASTAAGKGTFGTEEIVRRVEPVHLSAVVSHRKLVVPQLGAPGGPFPPILAGRGHLGAGTRIEEATGRQVIIGQIGRPTWLRSD